MKESSKKHKLQVLIAGQKALMAKFEELVNETTEVDPKKVYIKGHQTRGAEVIKMLEDLGGVNYCNYKGVFSFQGYFITDKGYISSTSLGYFKGFTELHLPEEVSAEDAQHIDIKVGDWIWVDRISISNTTDSDTTKIINNNPHNIVKINKDGDICFDVAGGGMFINPWEGDKFHKVDPLKDIVKWTCEVGFPFIGRTDSGTWRCSIFWRPTRNGNVIDMRCHVFKEAMPFNEETKKFIGSKDDPSIEYRFVYG